MRTRGNHNELNDMYVHSILYCGVCVHMQCTLLPPFMLYNVLGPCTFMAVQPLDNGFGWVFWIEALWMYNGPLWDCGLCYVITVDGLNCPDEACFCPFPVNNSERRCFGIMSYYTRARRYNNPTGDINHTLLLDPRSNVSKSNTFCRGGFLVGERIVLYISDSLKKKDLLIFLL